MFRFLLILVFGLISQVSFSQTSKCLKSLRTGKFTYEGQEGNVEIIRTKRTQTEVFNNGESKLILDIKWENDSTYVLTLKEAINAPGCLEKGDSIRTVITTCEGDKFYCKYTSENCGSGESTFIKLK